MSQEAFSVCCLKSRVILMILAYLSNLELFIDCFNKQTVFKASTFIQYFQVDELVYFEKHPSFLDFLGCSMNQEAF